MRHPLALVRQCIEGTHIAALIGLLFELGLAVCLTLDLITSPLKTLECGLFSVVRLWSGGNALSSPGPALIFSVTQSDLMSSNICCSPLIEDFY